jgi:hypothetical protein
MGILKITQPSGVSLLGELNATISALGADADDRSAAVNERLRELETELVYLRQVQRKLDAAAGTS